MFRETDHSGFSFILFIKISESPTRGLSVYSLHVLPVYVWVLSGYSGFLPPSKNMHVRLIDDSKLSLGVSVSVCGCLSCLSLCGPVMDWRPVQGVPLLSPDDCWDRLQPPRDLTDGLSGYRKWMDGWKISESVFDQFYIFKLQQRL